MKILTLTLIFALAFVGGCSKTENEPSPKVQATELNSAAVRHSEIAKGDSSCPYGGILVETGIDKDGSGVLDAAEVQKKEKVCNGEPGAKGDPGIDGVGSAGPKGNSALVNVAEASSAACPNGGKTVSTGVDSNGDGVLDSGESTSFSVCNGDDGTNADGSSVASIVSGESLTITTLISSETLSAWIGSGVVNGTGADRVVILDVNTAATYSAGHIPGALHLDQNNLYKTRQEGPAKDVSMVADGAAMDDLIQKLGIDKDTTIVFTGGSGAGSAPLQVTRAYFTFRYWGFRKEKLKFLDGVNFAWKATYGAGSMATGPQPAVTASTYSVRKNAALRADLRASLSEMIAVAAYGPMSSAVPVDMRSSMTATSSSYAGAPGITEGVFAPTSPKDYTVFEGHIKGAKALNYNDLFDSSNSYRFKPAATLAAMYQGVGIDKTIRAHVY